MVADLGSALAALANSMEPQAATEIARGLAAALEKSRETESDRLSDLRDALAALANKVEPQAAARDWLASTLSELLSCST